MTGRARAFALASDVCTLCRCVHVFIFIVKYYPFRLWLLCMCDVRSRHACGWAERAIRCTCRISLTSITMRWTRHSIRDSDRYSAVMIYELLLLLRRNFAKQFNVERSFNVCRRFRRYRLPPIEFIRSFVYLLLLRYFSTQFMLLMKGDDKREKKKKKYSLTFYASGWFASPFSPAVITWMEKERKEKIDSRNKFTIDFMKAKKSK